MPFWKKDDDITPTTPVEAPPVIIPPAPLACPVCGTVSADAICAVDGYNKGGAK